MRKWSEWRLGVRTGESNDDILLLLLGSEVGVSGNVRLDGGGDVELVGVGLNTFLLQLLQGLTTKFEVFLRRR